MKIQNTEKFSLLLIPKRSLVFVVVTILALSGLFVLKFPRIVNSHDKNGIAGYAISGNVKSDGLDLPNTVVILRGATTTSTAQTDAGGNYSFSNLQAGSYTVTVAKQQHVFTPANQFLPNVNSDQTANFTGMPQCAVPAANLAAWYKGEGNPNDSSTHDNHGFLANGPGFAPGKVNQAFSFDGVDDFFTLSYPYVNDFGTGDFTVEFWVKFNDLASNGNGLVAKDYTGGGGYNGWLFNIDDAAGGVGFQTRNSGAGSNTNARYATSNFQTDRWYHLAGIRRGRNLEFYVDGALRATATETVPANVSNNSSFVRIGSSSYEAPQYFAGLIDEVRAYYAALSGNEIQNSYESGRVGVCTSNYVFTTHRSGKIAFSSGRLPGGNGIYTMNADGSSPVNISNYRWSSDMEAAWSPDGSKIAFLGSGENGFDIFTINSDGSNRTRLTTETSNDSQPSWSPDGKKIIFYSNRTGGGDIYLMNPDGTNQTRLTTDPNVEASPKFSPDGSKIVFHTNRDGNYEIYTMNADGSNPLRLTSNTVIDSMPAFSPDGSKIVFFRVGAGIHVMNADGSNPVNLLVGWIANWSPDGTEIIYAGEGPHGNDDIWTMNIDGSDRTNLTNISGPDNYPSWQAPNPSVSVSLASDLNLTFNNVTQAGNTTADLLAPNQMPALPNGYDLYPSAPVYDIRTTAHAGNVTVALKISNVANSSTCGELRLVHFETDTWSTANNATPTYNAETQACTISQMVRTLSPFAVVHFAPTAANVSVGGRVLSANGTGIRNVVISLTDANGASRAARTNAFGYYYFDEVPIGTTILSVWVKRFTFANPTQVINLSDNIADINWTAVE